MPSAGPSNPARLRHQRGGPGQFSGVHGQGGQEPRACAAGAVGALGRLRGQHVAEVLARIEAGAGREIGDGIELRERCLELFKVTSRGGAPEVWLLGQKLLGPQA